MTRHIRYIVAAVILLMLNTSLALGTSVSIDSSNAGKGIFTVQGSDMDGVTGIEMTLKYDTPALTSPTVTLGNLVPGAMLAANTNIPGSIRIAIIRLNAFSGSGHGCHHYICDTYGRHCFNNLPKLCKRCQHYQ